MNLEITGATPGTAPLTGKRRQAAAAAATRWYKNAIIYELHIRAFSDGDGDGIGDFAGLIQKLDYLVDLGVTAIWILPFYPSPLKDDGYDIADYYNINPTYGTLKDFKTLLREAHKRGLKVITELVINHTSDQHEWFQKSRRAPKGSYWRDFYVWSDTPTRYRQARIIFKDFEASNWTWDPVAKSYFWHRFYSHQPDLNFENPEVQKAIFKVMDFWLEMGVDGLRLDAVPYLFEKENSSCENLPETHAFLKKLRQHIDDIYPDCMLLAEANQWPEDAVRYFGQDDECHMCFHFPLMPRLFMAIRMEDRYPIIDILKQTPEIGEASQWALFLRNHDELTLEMVTDEERDYMYKVYASDPKAAINLGIRRRLAPLVGNDRRQIELLNGLLFSLPGTPVLYYGDEIGMGDNIHLGDRNGVRTPFQWSPDRNAGFSKADPQSLYLPIVLNPEYHYETINVETAQSNSNSLLWWMKKLISIRKNYSELGFGQLQFVDSENPKVLSFVRSHEGKTLLVVANLARSMQHLELQLSQFKGRTPVELFGLAELPAIGDTAYPLTIGPYGFYWFELRESPTTEAELRRAPIHIYEAESPFLALQKRDVWHQFEKELLRYLPKARWFLGKGGKLISCRFVDRIDFEPGRDELRAAIYIIEASYREGSSEFYVLPLGYRVGEEAQKFVTETPHNVIARFRGSDDEGGEGVIHEMTALPEFGKTLAKVLLRQRHLEGKSGEIFGELFDKSRRVNMQDLDLARLTGAEQSNSSYMFGKKYFLKLFRKVEAGESPEIEIGRFLGTNRKFSQAPALVGSLYYVHNKKRYPIGVMQTFTENEGDGWSLFLNHLQRLAETANATLKPEYTLDIPHAGYVESLDKTPPPELLEHGGHTFALARLLGQRTAEMHIALAGEEESADFKPELFTPFYRRSLYQSFRNTAVKSLNALKKVLPELTPEYRALAEAVLGADKIIDKRFVGILSLEADIYRARVHGDYHLGQVLYTGKDFVVVDFEGEPIRPVGQRRLKRCPLSDVAGMIRSFEYLGAYYLKEKLLRPEDRKKLTPFVRSWAWWASSEYLKVYLEVMSKSELIPKDIQLIQRLLEIYILDKALYELEYEIKSRPTWMDIPLSGILKLLGGLDS